MDYIQDYQKNLCDLIGAIDRDIIQSIINHLDCCNKSGASIYIIGNGGSAATASHMQNDWGTGLKRRDILNLNIISLCDMINVVTYNACSLL